MTGNRASFPGPATLIGGKGETRMLPTAEHEGPSTRQNCNCWAGSVGSTLWYPKIEGEEKTLGTGPPRSLATQKFPRTFEVDHHHGLLKAWLVQEGESVRQRIEKSKRRELLPQCQNRWQVEDDEGRQARLRPQGQDGAGRRFSEGRG